MPTPHPVHLFPGVDVPVVQLSSNVVHHPDSSSAPTSIVYVAGLAEVAGATPDVLVDGYTYGSLSMMCHTI